LVSVIGHFISPTPGETVLMKGLWTTHPKFGEQFKVVHYQTRVPATVYGIKKYLGSGLIKGIGPKIAERIVSSFGKDTLNVIEEDTDKLSRVDGIGEKRVAMIKKAWDDQKEIREVMLFLQSHGVSPAYATKIFKHYGNDSIKTVQENPYRLAMDIFGIGFVTADRIAEKLGFSKDSELRAKAGVIYVLHQLADEGHVFYPRPRLIEKSREKLQTEPDIIQDAITKLTEEQHLVLDELPAGEESFKNDQTAVYLKKYHLCESRAAARLKMLTLAPSSLRKIDMAAALTWVQQRLDIQLADRQAAALNQALESKAMVITGGPGTGKTTIIRSLIEIFSRLHLQILLAAPTGRAAKRMSEATGHPASTIHRLLAYSIQKGGFQKNEDHPLDCDLLILDETSMIDIILMHHLLKAVPVSARLILVGDIHQLPSVGAGNVLADIIGSGLIPVVELNEIFRQARGSRIIVNAHQICAGVIPRLTEQAADSDFYFIEREDPQAAVDLILKLVVERIPNRFHLDPIADVQILSPMNRGIAGVANLNQVLQNALNAGDDQLNRGGRSFRMGDKVMQIRNNYDKDVYNGDIGRITGINLDDQEVVITFDGREVIYDLSDMDEVVLAYAVSIHKSQGSEYPAVIIPVLTQHYVLLQRNLIYTAITRGKRLVVIVGSKKAIAMAIRNNKIERRFTLLENRLSRMKSKK
ncbi:MAG: ATP-dependent RecD-like DNA helicase, partial [Desulfatirhabdiaceae bacterium]